MTAIFPDLCTKNSISNQHFIGRPLNEHTISIFSSIPNLHLSEMLLNELTVSIFSPSQACRIPDETKKIQEPKFPSSNFQALKFFLEGLYT